MKLALKGHFDNLNYFYCLSCGHYLLEQLFICHLREEVSYEKPTYSCTQEHFSRTGGMYVPVSSKHVAGSSMHGQYFLTCMIRRVAMKAKHLFILGNRKG